MKFITITEEGREDGVTETTKYHDDMYGGRVTIQEFPYSVDFGDFRMFEGVKLYIMDGMIATIAKTMTKIYEEIEMEGGTRLRCTGLVKDIKHDNDERGDRK